MTRVSDNPHSNLAETFNAARELLPLYGDGRGGYLLSAERDGADLLLGVGRLTTGARRWTDEDLGTVRLSVGDEVEATILARLPDLPRCRCNCGQVVRAPGAAVVGHTRPRFAAGGVCRHGHLLTAETVYISPKGQRECRTCRAEKSARVARARKDAA